MAQANRSLSPKRALERIRQHRCAVITLAMQRAKSVVKRQLQAQGLKLSHFSAKDITLLAEAELERNRAELTAEAEHAIATWPGFTQWRIPVFEKIAETEHSSNTNSANIGEAVND